MRALSFEPEAIAEAKRTRKHPASVPVMHIRRALRLGVLATSAPAEVARLVANALQTEARCLGKEFASAQVVRFLQSYRIAIARGQLEEIVADEARFAAMTVEERGERLKLSKKDRVAHKLWMLGAHGQTKEEREAEREQRQRLRLQARNDRSRAMRASTRDPLHINVSQAAEALGLDRRAVKKLHETWKVHVYTERETATHISEPCKEFLIYAAQVCTKPVSRQTPWEAQGVSRATYYRLKAKGNPAGEVEPASGPARDECPAPFDTEPVCTKAGRKLALPNRSDVTNVVQHLFYVSPDLATSVVRMLDFSKRFEGSASTPHSGPVADRKVRHGRR